MAIDKTYGLTSETRVKTRIGITVTSFDDLIKTLIYGATDFIEGYCQRRFKRATYTQELYDGSQLDGTPKRLLVLRNAPLISISALQYKTGTRSSPTWVDFQADTYQEKLGDTAIVSASLPGGFQNIRTTYVAGYLIDFSAPYDSALHTLPFDLTDLCERMVVKAFKKRESEGRSSEVLGSSSITWTDVFTEQDKQVLANYQRPQIV